MTDNTPHSEQKANSPQSGNTSDQEQPYRPAGRPVRKATYKQKKLAELVSTTPVTHREAYRQVYDAENMSDGAVDTEVYKTLKKPSVQIELSKYNDKARLALLKVLDESDKRMKQASDRDGSAWGKLLKDTADSVLDRTEGRAVQRIQSQSTTVTLSLSLSDLISGDSDQDDTSQNN